MYNKTNKEPNIDPCVTPHAISDKLERLINYHKFCVTQVAIEKLKMHISNALLRSIKITLASFFYIQCFS